MLGVVLGFLGGIMGLKYSIPPLSNFIDQKLNEVWPTGIQDVTTLVTLRMRQHITTEKYHELMKKHGYSEGVADAIYKTYEFFPSPTDIMSLTDRGALWESSMEKWPQMFEPPAIAVEWAKKANVPKEVLSKYWFAHYTQPDFFRIRDMYHRGLIDKDIIDGVMEYQGYSEYWRPKLIEVLTLPPTRTDIRRMHKLGVITDDEVREYYRWQHYDERTVENLTQWTVEYNRQTTETKDDEYRDLTRSMIEHAYEDNLITRPKAIALLQEINYREEDAELILSIIDYDRERKEIDEQIDYITEAVRGGKTTVEDAIVELTKLNLPSDRITYLSNKLQRIVDTKVSIPSKDDLKMFLQMGIISEGEYRYLMRKHGYADKHIDWYLQAVGVS